MLYNHWDRIHRFSCFGIVDIDLFINVLYTDTRNKQIAHFSTESRDFLLSGIYNPHCSSLHGGGELLKVGC